MRNYYWSPRFVPVGAGIQRLLQCAKSLKAKNLTRNLVVPGVYSASPLRCCPPLNDKTGPNQNSEHAKCFLSVMTSALWEPSNPPLPTLSPDHQSGIEVRVVIFPGNAMCAPATFFYSPASGRFPIAASSGFASEEGGARSSEETGRNPENAVPNTRMAITAGTTRVRSKKMIIRNT